MSDTGPSQQLNRYQQIIERVFLAGFKPGAREVAFDREDLARAANELGIAVPKNLGDILYTFRYRGNLPGSVKGLAPAGEEWVIRPANPATDLSRPASRRSLLIRCLPKPRYPTPRPA